MRLLPGDDGCGPPGHSSVGGISEIAPLRGAGTLLAFGSRRHWRGPIVAWGAIAIVVISGMLEVLVLALRSAFTCAPRNCRPRVARRHGGCLIDHRWCRGDGVRRGKHSARCYSAVLRRTEAATRSPTTVRMVAPGYGDVKAVRPPGLRAPPERRPRLVGLARPSTVGLGASCRSALLAGFAPELGWAGRSSNHLGTRPSSRAPSTSRSG